MQSFDLSHANQLSISDAKEYIKRYFYPLASGLHVQVDYDEDEKPVYEIKEDKVIKSVYFNRLPKVIYDFYFKEYDQIKSLTCEINKPFIFGKFINTCPSFLHELKPYSEYPKEIKVKVELMLTFLKEIWASDNEAQYQFLIKWLARMARGEKNQSVLYLKSEQGIGKSTFTDFLRKHVIGSQLCIQSGSQPLISQFNKILFCKLLVIFEELENFSTNQWQGVSTRLKRDTTSDTCTYEEKHEKAFTARNISNYIINSNVDAIKDDDGRRYFILDLSNKRKGDINYFNKIYSNCMNDAVGEAFFAFLNSVDLTGYHDQDFPLTKAKEDAIVKRLDSVARYIKEKYILKYKNFDTNLKDAHVEYTDFCSANNIKESCKIEFNKRLEAYKITSYKSGNIHNKFNYKHSMLEEIAVANKWKHSTDQYDNGDVFTDDNLDNGISKDLEEKDAEIKALKEQIEILKNKLQSVPVKDKPLGCSGINALACNPLDVGIEEKEEEPITQPQMHPVIIDPCEMLMQEIEDSKIWMEEFLKMTKPKKKINKKQIQQDLFEIDFLCN
jgi:hypothetical protein